MHSNGTFACNNGAVTSPRKLALCAPLLVLSLALTACGGSDEKAVDKPTPSVTPKVEVPEGVTLTDAGEKLTFGSPATVAYEANPDKGSVLQMSVAKVEKAGISELSAYQLDAATKSSTPFYVTVDVTNVGSSDLGGVDVPIFLVDSKNTLIHSSSFTNTFKPCPSTPLPKSFAPQAKTKACLLYLVPAGSTFTEMSFRPVQDVEPIVWTGTAGKSAAVTKAEAAKKKKAGN